MSQSEAFASVFALLKRFAVWLDRVLSGPPLTEEEARRLDRENCAFQPRDV